MTRVVDGLLWARQTDRPTGLPRRRPRGAKAAGLRYEAALARALPEAKHGRWFAYEDKRGPGLCQTDLILPLVDRYVVLEVKYSWTVEGHRQLEHLYLPVLEAAFPGKKICGLVVCRRLVPAMQDVVVVGNLEEAIHKLSLSPRPRVVWHWLATDAVLSRAA